MDDGAHYFRSDFQVHTPRDINWKGHRAVTDDERRQYAHDFVPLVVRRRFRPLRSPTITTWLFLGISETRLSKKRMVSASRSLRIKGSSYSQGWS